MAQGWPIPPLRSALVLFEESHIIKLAGAEEEVPVTGTNWMCSQCNRT